MAEGDAGEGLVEVHAAVLLAIGAEADDVVFAVELGHVAEDLAVLGVEPAQHAVEAEHQVDAADPLADVAQGGARRFHHVRRLGDRQDDAVVDGAEEGQRAVRRCSFWIERQ